MRHKKSKAVGRTNDIFYDTTGDSGRASVPGGSAFVLTTKASCRHGQKIITREVETEEAVGDNRDRRLESQLEKGVR